MKRLLFMLLSTFITVGMHRGPTLSPDEKRVFEHHRALTLELKRASSKQAKQIILVQLKSLDERMQEIHARLGYAWVPQYKGHMDSPEQKPKASVKKKRKIKKTTRQCQLCKEKKH